MPRYVFKCGACEETFMVRHSINSTFDKCKECDVEGELVRVPSSVFVTTTKVNEKTQQKAGEVVKQNIEEFKQDLKKEKERLRETDYER